MEKEENIKKLNDPVKKYEQYQKKRLSENIVGKWIQ